MGFVMIVVRVWQSDGAFRAFLVTGHDGSAPRGQSLLCAGVSTLCQAVVLALEKILVLDVSVEKRSGFLYCVLQNLPPQQKDSVKLLFLMLLYAVNDLQVQFPTEIRVESL